MKTLTGAIVLSLGLGLHAINAQEATNVVRYASQPTGNKVSISGTSTIHDWTMDSALVGGFMERSHDNGRENAGSHERGEVPQD